MRLDERPGRAGLQAQRARAALVERRRVHRERQGADDLRQEQPRAELGVDEAAVLADPAEAGILRVDALLDRPRVDVRARLERLGAGGPQPVQELPRAPPDDRVVVLAPGVARDTGLARVRLLGRVRPVDVVVGGERDHRARARQHLPHVGAARGGPLQIPHLACVTAVEPLPQERQLRERAGGGDAAQREPQVTGAGLDVVGRRHVAPDSAAGIPSDASRSPARARRPRPLRPARPGPRGGSRPPRPGARGPRRARGAPRRRAERP